MALKVYRALSKGSGGSVIVDTSKPFSVANLLASISEIDLRVIHLVRDSRAVARSRSRWRSRPEITSRRTHMGRYSALGSGLQWSTSMQACERFRRRGDRVLPFYYEDLVAEPSRVLDAVLPFAEHDASRYDLGFVRQRSVEPVPGHGLLGNPNRFRCGPVELLPDDAWLREMGRGSRLLVTLMTLPWLLRHGYLRPPRRRRVCADSKLS